MTTIAPLCHSIKALMKRCLRAIDGHFPSLVFRSSSYTAAAAKWLGPASNTYATFRSRGFSANTSREGLTGGEPEGPWPGSVQAWEAKVILDLESLVLQRFYDPEVGKPYKLDKTAKTELVDKILVITQQIPTATSWLYHLALATGILRLPCRSSGRCH